MIQTKNYEFINLLKFLAVVLVLNSHYDKIYPIHQLATGGALGNGLFFIVSGFLLANINQKFGLWFKRRLSRIYIVIYIATAAMILVSASVPMGLSEWLKILIWPTKFWFIGALVIFYPLYYILVKNNLNKNFKSISLLLLLAYIVYYVCLLDTTQWVVEAIGLESKEGLFKLIYYFYIMIIGAWIRKNSHRFKNINIGVHIVGAFMAVIVLYGSKELMNQNPFLMKFQFINQVCVAFFAFFVMLIFMNKEKYFIYGYKRKNNLYKFIAFIADISLEIYLVQFMVIDKFKGLIFPLNFIVVTLIVVILAYFLHKLMDCINIILKI